MSGKGGKGKKAGAKRHQRVLRDNIQGITKPAIRRLCRRGGVKRIAGLVYEETRGALKLFLENIIRDAVNYTEHARRKTVTALDVVYSLKKHDKTIYGFEYPKEKGRGPPRDENAVKTTAKRTPGNTNRGNDGNGSGGGGGSAGAGTNTPAAPTKAVAKQAPTKAVAKRPPGAATTHVAKKVPDAAKKAPAVSAKKTPATNTKAVGNAAKKVPDASPKAPTVATKTQAPAAGKKAPAAAATKDAAKKLPVTATKHTPVSNLKSNMFDACEHVLVCVDKELFKRYDYFENLNYVNRMEKISIPEDSNLPLYFGLFHIKKPTNTAVTFLKMSLSPTADNLVYEYLIGDAINHFGQTPNTIMTLGITLLTGADFTFIQRHKDELTVKDLKERIPQMKPKHQITQAGVGAYNRTAIQFAGIELLKTLENYISPSNNVFPVGHEEMVRFFWKSHLAPVLFQIYSFLTIYQNVFTHYNLKPYNISVNYIPTHYFNLEYVLEDGTTLQIVTKYLVKILDFSESVILNYSDTIIDKVKELDPQHEGAGVGYFQIKENVEKGIDNSKDLSLIKKLLPVIRDKEIPQHLRELLNRVNSKGQDRIKTVQELYYNLITYFRDSRTILFKPAANTISYGRFIIKTDIPNTFDDITNDNYHSGTRCQFVRGV